jgi:Holliday junction resolvasome RuvABC endonuclease subunit
MKILSFDQSTRLSGFALFDGFEYVDSGIIDLHKITDTSERTRQMGIAICNKIKECAPDVIIIEEVQQQNNADTLKKLARLQGIAIGFAAAHDIQLHIVEPTKWRKALNYKQGKAVKREELKQQSIDYVQQHFGFNFSEDRCEAICINVASQKLFDLMSLEDM